jgi:hypothetical protein
MIPGKQPIHYNRWLLNYFLHFQVFFLWQNNYFYYFKLFLTQFQAKANNFL